MWRKNSSKYLSGFFKTLEERLEPSTPKHCAMIFPELDFQRLRIHRHRINPTLSNAWQLLPHWFRRIASIHVFTLTWWENDNNLGTSCSIEGSKFPQCCVPIKRNLTNRSLLSKLLTTSSGIDKDRMKTMLSSFSPSKFTILTYTPASSILLIYFWNRNHFQSIS